MEKSKPLSEQSLRALDALNIFLADVRDGVGPYLAVYLLTIQHWDPARIGITMSAMGTATMLAQTPCGMSIDMLKQKRLLIGAAAAIFPLAVAAITLGLVGPKMFAARMERNEAFNHAGNVGAAALAGTAGAGQSSWVSHLTTDQLKTLQEVIALTVFILFAQIYLGEALKLKHLLGFTVSRLGSLDGVPGSLWS